MRDKFHPFLRGAIQHGHHRLKSFLTAFKEPLLLGGLQVETVEKRMIPFWRGTPAIQINFPVHYAHRPLTIGELPHHWKPRMQVTILHR